MEVLQAAGLIDQGVDWESGATVLLGISLAVDFNNMTVVSIFCQTKKAISAK
jgi:hypothetical protein